MSDEFERQQWDQHLTEDFRMRFDLVKHITTLSSGAIVLGAALHKGLVGQGTAKWVLATAFVSLALSTLAGVSYLFVLSVARSRQLGTVPDSAQRALSRTIGPCVVCFGVGIIAVAIYAALNV
jgi:hypothetical protein